MRKPLILFVVGFVLSYLIFSSPVQAPVPLEDSVVALTDRDYFPAVLDVIESSEVSIHALLFEMRYYDSAQYRNSNENKLVEALIAAAARGVDVRVLLDEYDNRYDDRATKMVRFLRENGIDAKLDDPTTTTHTKLLIIDGIVVIVGSTNWSYYAIDLNHEASVLVRSAELASRFDDYFGRLWSSV